VLQSQRSQPPGILGCLFRICLEDLVEKSLLIELNGVIIVRPCFTGAFRPGVAAAHAAQLAESDAAILCLQGPAEVGEGLIDTFDEAFSHGEEEKGAENGFGGRSPVAARRLIAPTLDDIAVLDD